MSKYDLIARKIDNTIRNVAIGLAVYVIIVNFML
jgi:hypothetical protein